MKATELIEHLKKLVEENGDLDVVTSIYGDCKYESHPVKNVFLKNRRYAGDLKKICRTSWFFTEHCPEEMRAEKVIAL